MIKITQSFLVNRDVLTHVAFFKSAFVIWLDKSVSTFLFSPNVFGLEKYSILVNLSKR